MAAAVDEETPALAPALAVDEVAPAPAVVPVVGEAGAGAVATLYGFMKAKVEQQRWRRRGGG